MYLPAAHVEKSTEALLEFIKQNPLGVLTTAIASPSYPLIQASHVPWVLDIIEPPSQNDDDDGKVKGRLRGHMAKQNPQAKALIESITSSSSTTLEQDVLVLFTGSDHSYVTPKFYTETKPTTGKVVPTWNYAAVQVYGKATIWVNSKSAETSNFLNKQISDLSLLAETSIMGFDGKPNAPWTVSESPERFIELLKTNIIGIEISITHISGKFKMSQEMGKLDREGVIEGFKNLGTEKGDRILKLIKQRSDIKEASKNASG
ncbi:putative FMN-binding domain-containing protein [Lipomyces japonicus]|uniref:putative FMN-binding domain-containing protein n=1 Tax=Lipomyces japonicus TaxID=56871 RepID=UPI0034CDD7EE